MAEPEQQWPGVPVGRIELPRMPSGELPPLRVPSEPAIPAAAPGEPRAPAPESGLPDGDDIADHQWARLPPRSALPKRTLDAGRILSEGMRTDELAAIQGISPHANSPLIADKPSERPVMLGFLEDDEGPVYKSPGAPHSVVAAGEHVQFNPKTDFILPDPKTGRMAVWTRTPAAEEGRLTSLGRLTVPYITAPVTATVKAVPRALTALEQAEELLPVMERRPPGTAGQPPPLPTGTSVPVVPPAAPGAPPPLPGAGGPPANVPPGAPPVAPPAGGGPAALPYARPLAPQRAAQRVADLERDVQAFDELGIRKPPIAFTEGPMAGVGKMVSEIPYVGGPIKSSLDDALQGLARSTETVAGQFGTAREAEHAGTTVQEAIHRFRDARPYEIVERAVEGYSQPQLAAIIAAPARDSSMKTKQAALFQRAWSLIPEEMQAGRAVPGLTRVQGGLENARNLLQEITDRNTRMTLQSGAQAASEAATAPIASSGQIGAMVTAILNPRYTASLQTMRDIRSEFRRLAAGMADTEKNTMRLSDIERFQSAVTRDMINLLQRNGDAYRALGDARMAQGALTEASEVYQTARNFGRSITEFRRADQFTRLGAERMEYIERLFNAPKAEDLYRSVWQASLSKGKGDLERLRILRRTLRPEEMNDVAAGVLRQMGAPTGSARGLAQAEQFSPTTMATQWGNMTEQGRALIFGHDHAREIDNLMRVAKRLANVEALANTSKSGTHLINAILGLGGLSMAWNGQAAALGAGLGAGAGFSVLLSRPGYVKWINQYAKAKAAALAAPTKKNTQHLMLSLNQLYRLTVKDPQLVPIYRAIAAEEGIGQQSPEQQNEKQRVRP